MYTILTNHIKKDNLMQLKLKHLPKMIKKLNKVISKIKLPVYWDITYDIDYHSTDIEGDSSVDVAILFKCNKFYHVITVEEYITEDNYSFNDGIKAMKDDLKEFNKIIKEYYNRPIVDLIRKLHPDQTFAARLIENFYFDIDKMFLDTTIGDIHKNKITLNDFYNIEHF